MLTESFHTHTYRCNHASGSEREYVQCAINSDMKILGFSDHSPHVFDGDYYSGFRMKHDQIQGYFDTLLGLKDEFKDKIELHVGFEAEYYPKHFGEFERLIKSYPTEYLLMGQHFLLNEIENVASMRKTTDEGILKLYVDQCSEGLATGLFACMAHPDCINFIGDDDTYTREITRLCENAKKYNVALEINLLGIRTSRHYPNEKFWKIAGEVGNTVVCGCDAHEAESVCDNASYEKAQEMAKLYKLNLQNASEILNGGHKLI